MGNMGLGASRDATKVSYSHVSIGGKEVIKGVVYYADV